MLATISRVALLLLLSSTKAVAPGPGQVTPPGVGHRFMVSKLAPAVLQLATFGRKDGAIKSEELIYNPKLLDQFYGLSKGSVEACLDDVLHGNERMLIDIIGGPLKDFVNIINPPTTCLGIVKEVSGREEYKDIKPEDMMVSLVPGDDSALRIRGFEKSQLEMLLEIASGEGFNADDDLGIDVRVV